MWVFRQLCWYLGSYVGISTGLQEVGVGVLRN